MDIFDFFDMFSEIGGFFKAAGESIGNLFNPKKKRSFIHKPDDKPTHWGADSYEPWDFLSKEQWEEILRGDKSLEDFTMSHAWPPEKQEDNNIVEVEQENEQEQNEDSENAESSEADDSVNPDENSGVEADDSSESSGVFDSDGFESDSSFEAGDCDSGDSGSYDGYIG